MGHPQHYSVVKEGYRKGHQKRRRKGVVDEAIVEQTGGLKGEKRGHTEDYSSAIDTIVSPPPKRGKIKTAEVQSNWANLKSALKIAPGGRSQLENAETAVIGGTVKKAALPLLINGAIKPQINETSTGTAQLTKVVALDCEMVGVGKRGDRSVLARVSVVNAAGSVVFDSFVAPTEPVTDFRTKFSGVRARDLRNAPPFSQVKEKLTAILKGRVLVGHALTNDLGVLGIKHPAVDIRDTSKFLPFMRILPNGRAKAQALRHLAKEHLDMSIQSTEHNSIEDARAALALYQKQRREWDQKLVKPK